MNSNREMISGLLNFLSKNSGNSKVVYNNEIWYYKFSHKNVAMEPALFKVIYTGDFIIDDYKHIEVFDEFHDMKSALIKMLSSDDMKHKISVYKRKKR